MTQLSKNRANENFFRSEMLRFINNSTIQVLDTCQGKNVDKSNKSYTMNSVCSISFNLKGLQRQVAKI